MRKTGKAKTAEMRARATRRTGLSKSISKNRSMTLGARSSVPTQYIANTLQEDGQCSGTSPGKFMLIPFKMFPVRVPAVY